MSVIKAKWLPLGILLTLQGADLASTWLGIHYHGLREMDGTPFGVLVVLKLAALGIYVWLSWGKAKIAWVLAGVTLPIYTYVLVHNARLILGS